MASFFPNPSFGWVFLSALLALLVAACIIDLRTVKIPNALSVAITIVGLLANIVRGSLLGHAGQSVWLLPGGAWYGCLDGALFSLAGLLVGFVLSIPLFATGIAGGGDGKLLAAVAAWLGPQTALWILLAASLIMLPLMFLRYTAILVVHGLQGARHFYRAPADGQKRPFIRLMAFSPAVMLAVAVVVLWNYRGEFGFTSPPPDQRPAPQHSQLHGGGDAR